MTSFRTDRSFVQDICLVLAFLMIIEPALLISPLIPSFGSKVKAASDPASVSLEAAQPVALIVRHAPVINSGLVEGTLWFYQGEDLVLNGNTHITDDLRVPGTPGIVLSDNASYGVHHPGLLPVL